MHANRQAVGSRERRVTPGWLCAAVLAGSGFAVGTASGQAAAPEGATSWPPRAVALNRAVLTRSVHADLTPLLRSIKPRVRGGLAPEVRRRLALAHPMAIEWVYRVPTCGALFASLGADGVLKLANLRYHPATGAEEAGACRRGAAATEVVGSPDVRLCDLFGQLDTDVAALILIHEALHSAGLGEKPVDPDGLEAGEISLMVRKSCGP